MSGMTLRTRDQIDDQYKWNAPSVYADHSAWEAATDELTKMLPQVEQYKGKLSQGASILADFIDIWDSAKRLMEKIAFYAYMSSEVNTSDSTATAMTTRASSLYGQTMAAGSFLNPELIAIGEDTLKNWIEQEPRLGHCTQFVHDLFRRQAHVRSSEIEEILGLSGDAAMSVIKIFSDLTGADMRFPKAIDRNGNEHDVAQSTVTTYYTKEDRQLRCTTWQKYCDTYLGLKNTLTATYLTSVKQDVFQMRVRGFDSSINASLFNENIPRAVYDNLIDTFKKNIPTWHKYWAVRRKALGYDNLHPYDIWAPIAKEQPEVSHEQAVDWICESMKPLGEDYVRVMRKGCLEERWVDVYPNQGKNAGAFSYGTYDTSPFIMMSYDNTMGAMSTLAHELGHSMHTYLSNRTQPYINADYSLFVAEVASNFNQALTRAYLHEAYKEDTNFQIALIEEAMDNFHRYFFIMPTLARFELDVHERVERGEGITSDLLINLMADLFQEGYGDAMTVDRSRVGITWATFGHLYNAFYVYQYATGISAAHALADNILNGNKDAAKRYVEFLSAGGSMYPLDALRHAGVDMIKPDAVETTFGVLADMVDRLAELVVSTPLELSMGM